MKLEGLLTNARKHARKTLIAGLASSMLFLSACGSGSSNSGGNSNPGSNPDPDPPGGAPETYVLPEEDKDKIIGISNNGITFSEPVSFSEGIIIASSPNLPMIPHGFLRWADSISSDGMTVYTSQATLSETIWNGSFSSQEPIYPNSYSFTPLKKGVSDSTNLGSGEFSVNLDNMILYDEDGSFSTLYDQIRGNGNLLFSLDFVFDFSVSNGTLESLVVKSIISESSSAGISPVGSSIFDIDRETKVAEYNLSPIILYTPTTPPIPIVVTPRIEVILNLKGDISVDFDTNITQNANLTLGLSYENGLWNPIGDFSNSFTKSVIPDNSNVYFSIGPRLSFLLYGITGPYGEVNGSLEFNSDTSSWELYGGLNANMGIEMTVFGNNIADYSADVIDYRKLLDSSGGEGVPQPGQLTQLTFGSFISRNPSWSPDGNKIIYSYSGDIKTMNTDGTNRTTIVEGYEPSFSPDGTRILYEALGYPDQGIHTIAVNRTGKQKLTDHIFDSGPEWSPDGSKIVFIDGGNNGVWTMDYNGNNRKMLTDPDGYMDSHPAWSPNGSEIVFNSDKVWNGGIYIMNSSNGTNLRKIIEGTTIWPEVSFSPDGSKIIYSCWDFTNFTEDVCIVNSDGTNNVNLTNDPSRDYDASFSPDGRQIAFVSDRSGKTQIYKLVLP